MRKIENSIWLWLKDERISIISTIVCPVLSVLLSAGIPIGSYLLDTKDGKSNGFDYYPQVITILYFLQLIFLIVSLYFILSNRTAILRLLNDKESLLIRYFQKECHIRNEEDSPLIDHFTVVRDTVKQFYYCWVIIWTLWILYYGIESIDRLLPDATRFTGLQLHYAFKCVIDFSTSIVLFFLYLILNNVTVYRQKREEANPNEVRYGFMFLMMCICIIGALFLYSFSVSDEAVAFGYMMVVSLALGTFATFVFVILLGKMNSFYLQIPIVLNLFVYFYAILQIFGPLTMLADGHEYFTNETSDGTFLYKFITLPNIRFEKINIAFLMVSLFGKFCLTMVLYWIVYKFRFIYFVITKSLSLTETPEKIKVFWRYIGEKGE